MQKYKIAENRMFQTGGHDFIFLAADNTIFEMDDRVKDILTQDSLPGEFTREDLFSGLNFPGQDQKNYFADLVQTRALIPLKTDSPQPAINFETLSIQLQTLVLHVTDACNLGCHYCYYCNDQESQFHKAIMSPEVATRAVDFLMEHSGGLKDVIIVFFGGEPLLNFDLITEIVAYARERGREKGINVDFSLTTNATLLNDKTIGFLMENHIGVTISIDGFETAHDRFRRFPNGSPSYRAILPGLKKLLANRGGKPVVARVTVAGDAKNVPEILDHLLSLGFSEAGFAPVTTRDAAYQLNKEEMDQLLEHFKSLSEKFISHARQDRFYGFTNLVDNLVVLHEGERKDYPCGAGMGLFSVDPEGRLYLCQRLTGDASSHMGDIFTGFNKSALAEFRGKAIIDEKKECAQCWVRKICAGGCYHEALTREGSLVKPNLHYCQWIKDWVQQGLDVYGKLTTQCPQYMDKLSMLRGHEPLFSRSIP